MTDGSVRRTAAVLVVAAWLVWLAVPGGVSWVDGAPWLVLAAALATLRFAAGWMLRVLGALVAVVLVTWPFIFETFFFGPLTQTRAPRRYSEEFHLYGTGITRHAVAVQVVQAPALLVVTGLVLACGLVLTLFPVGAAGTRMVAMLVLLAAMLLAVGALAWQPAAARLPAVVVGALALAAGFGAVIATARVRRALGAVAAAGALYVLLAPEDSAGMQFLDGAGMQFLSVEQYEQYQEHLGALAVRATLTGAAALLAAGVLMAVCGHQLPRLSWRRGG